MYIKTLLIVLVSASAIARPSDDHDDHEHHEILQNCSDSSEFPREKVEEIIFDETGKFCDEEPGRNWMTCYFKGMELMNDDYVLNEEHLQEDFVHDDQKLESFNECMTEAKEENESKRACTLYHCVLDKKIVDFGHEEEEEEEEHEDH